MPLQHIHAEAGKASDIPVPETTLRASNLLLEPVLKEGEGLSVVEEVRLVTGDETTSAIQGLGR